MVDGNIYANINHLVIYGCRMKNVEIMTASHALVCQAIVFSRLDKLHIKERRKKIHRKERMRGVQKEMKNLVYVIVVLIDTLSSFYYGVT